MREGVLIGWRCSGVAYNAHGFARFALLCTFWCSEVHGASSEVGPRRGAQIAMGMELCADMRKDGQDSGCFGESVERYYDNAEEKHETLVGWDGLPL